MTPGALAAEESGPERPRALPDARLGKVVIRGNR